MPDSILRDALPSGMTLHHTLRGHQDLITQIAWSPDGFTLASASLDGTLRLWDPKTSVLRQVLDGRSGGICSVAWSPDAKSLALGLAKGVIQVWHTETADLYRTIAVISDQAQPSLLFGDDLEDFSKAVCSVEWLPDGETIAAGTTNNSLTFWDVETGVQRQVQDVRVRNTSGIDTARSISRSAIIHGLDQPIFTRTVGTTISTTYGETGTQDKKREVGGYGRAAFNAFTTMGRQLLGATWPSRTLRLPLLRELIIRVPVTSLDRSPDGSMLASASLLASIRLWLMCSHHAGCGIIVT